MDCSDMIRPCRAGLRFAGRAVPGCASALALCIALLAGVFASRGGDAQSLTLALGGIEGEGWRAGDVRLAWTGGGGARVDLGLLEGFGRKFEKLSLVCATFEGSSGTWRCTDGVFDGGERFGVTFSYTPARRALEVAVTAPKGESWQLAQTGSAFTLTLANAQLARLAPWLPGEIKPSAGHANGSVRWSAETLEGDLELTGAAFANAAGLIAGENLAGRINLAATRAGAAWNWRIGVAWEAGAVLVDPIYVAEGGHALEAAGRLQGARLEIDSARLAIGSVGRVEARASLDWQANTISAWSVYARDLQLAGLRTFLPQAWLDQHGMGDLVLSGRASVSATARGAALENVNLTLRQAGAQSLAKNIGIAGVELDFADTNGAAPFRLDFTRAHLRNLGFGPVAARGAVRAGRLGIENLVIPVEDGVLALNEIDIGRTAGRWQAQWRGAFTPLSMERLTAALGWHPMKGSISAVIPQMRYVEDAAGSTFSADGALLFKVFGGDAQVDGIRIDNPFGRTPRLAANLRLSGLDLAEMTSAVKFGDISGKVDASVIGLEMENWEPLAFEARIATSAGDFRKRISQRAVQNISSIGGAGAGAAIQASLLGFFDSFGYSRLGLSCKLVNGVCEMGGVGPGPSGGYTIIAGGGVPAVNVVGYNRFVGWQEMLERIRAVIDGNSKMIVQ